MDHNVATGDDTPPDPLSHEQLETLRRNCEEFGAPLYATGSGLNATARQLGGVLGVAIVIAILGHAGAVGGHKAFVDAWTFAAIAAGLSAGAVLVLGRAGRTRAARA